MFRTVGSAITLGGMLVAGTVLADWDSNPGFELPYTTGWDSYNPAETANSTDFARTGTFSLKFTTPTVAPDPVEGGNLPFYTVIDTPLNAATPGVSYTASGYYYVPSPLLDHERLGIALYWYKLNSGGTALEFSSIDPGGYTTPAQVASGIRFGPETAATPPFLTGQETVGAWSQITYTGVAPADAEFMAVVLEVRGGGSDVYFDDITVIPEPTSILLVGLGIVGLGMTRRMRSGK